MPEKIVITGGPNTGKTTLFEQLRVALPDAGFVTEPATAVISALGDNRIADSPEEFCRLCIDVSVASEAAVRDNDLVIQDRSLIDTVAYAQRDGCEDLLPELHKQIEIAGYTGAILCDFVGTYKTNDVRYEDREQAIRTHEMLRAVYKSTKLPILYMPAYSEETRLNVALNAITTQGLFASHIN